MRSRPPVQILGGGATWNVPNTVVLSLLGRLPPGGLATGNTTLQLVDNGDNRLYADNRRTQVDMRFAKILRFGRTRTDVGVDLYNLLNSTRSFSLGDSKTLKLRVQAKNPRDGDFELVFSIEPPETVPTK